MDERNDMENKLDGNASAGALQAIFAFEMTQVVVTCGGCGASNLIAETVVYMSGMGTIVRCPACDHVLIRVARVKGRDFLDLQGSRVLRIHVEG